ncbi:MAG TPA: hypothetical protein VK673_02395 [Chthoniobacterales bacterium]|nr:hypothetical protein [Chthoniobacterales bacterium]
MVVDILRVAFADSVGVTMRPIYGFKLFGYIIARHSPVSLILASLRAPIFVSAAVFVVPTAEIIRGANARPDRGRLRFHSSVS